MRKKFYTIAFILILALGNIWCKNEIKEGDSVVVFVNGNVKVNGEQASVGTPIRIGDLISTGSVGLCRIQIGNKNVLQLGENSELLFTIWDSENTLVLNKGLLSGITRKIFTKRGTYTIITPTVVASVRGTSFCVVAQSVDRSYFCVCNGSIHLKGKDAEKGNYVIAAHHKGMWFEKGKDGKIAAKSAGLLFHDDKGLEELAASIHETIDWTTPDIH
ncbi:MAG: FecR family protein [Spirochaetota bacterium]